MFQTKRNENRNLWFRHDFQMIDMGDMKSARLTEVMIPFWLGVRQAEESTVFNFMIAK
jgi:hypothetical protein